MNIVLGNLEQRSLCRIGGYLSVIAVLADGFSIKLVVVLLGGAMAAYFADSFFEKF